jgi:hypothetical protein
VVKVLRDGSAVVATNEGKRILFTDEEAFPRAVEALFSPEFLATRQAQLDKMVVAYGPDVTIGQVDRRIERYRRLCETNGIKGRRFTRRLFCRAGWWMFLPKWTQPREERRENWAVIRWYYRLQRRDAYALVRLHAASEHAKMQVGRMGGRVDRVGRNRRLERVG